MDRIDRVYNRLLVEEFLKYLIKLDISDKSSEALGRQISDIQSAARVVLKDIDPGRVIENP